MFIKVKIAIINHLQMAEWGEGLINSRSIDTIKPYAPLDSYVSGIHSVVSLNNNEKFYSNKTLVEWDELLNNNY